MFQSSGIRVVRLLIYETLGYSPQYRRAYKTSTDGQVFDVLAERISRTDRVTTDAVIGVAHNFLMPTETIDSPNPILIPGGWDQGRCRFLLEVEYDFGGLGSKIREVFMGYTDHTGLSLQSNAIDPGMVFYMNSVTNLKVQDINTVNGVQRNYSVVDNSHILANNSYVGARNFENRLIRMRPDDVMATMQLSHLEQGDRMDDRTMMNQTAQKANRSTTTAPAYMAQVLDGYLTAARKQGDLGQDGADILEYARQRLVPQMSASQDPFMRAVAGIENGGTYIQDHFTYRTLCDIDPNTDRIAEVQVIPSIQRESFTGFADGNDWGDRTTYAQFATILSQSIPTILMETGLNGVKFQSTNRKGFGSMRQMQTNIVDVRSFSEAFSLEQQCNSFIERVNREVLTDLSFNNQMDFELMMSMTLHGDCIIELALNGDQNFERFVAPLFCDALMSPIVTSNFNQANNLAEHFGQLAGALAEANLLGSATNTSIMVGASGGSMVF